MLKDDPERDLKMAPRKVFVLTLLAAMFTAAWCSAAQTAQENPKPQNTQNKDKSAQPAKDAPASLTGCVDEQEGNYVLLSERTMNPIASLEADGFPKEGFAKHVGHKVTVRGTSSSQGTMPLIKVRTIETVSETCSPER